MSHSRAAGSKGGRLSCLAVFAALVPALAAPQANDLASVVAQFYPASLDADVAAIAAGRANVRHQCWVVLKADTSGTPVIVLAAYSNSQAGAVHLLVKGTAGFAVADQASGAAISGSSCRAEGVDIDADGTLEAVVRFGRPGGTSDWVYAWRDRALADLSPLTAEGVPIAVFNSELVDLDGDGVLELRSRPSRPDASTPALPIAIFRLSAGTYVASP